MQLATPLEAIRGTGPNGRIIGSDVREAAGRSTDPDTTRPATADAAGGTDRRVTASPLARTLADRLGIELGRVRGTGPGERIRLEDVLAAAGQLTAVPAEADTSDTELAHRPGDVIPLTGIRGVIAERMQASLAEMAQLTLMRDVEVGALVDFRRDLRAQCGPDDVLPSPTDLIVKATAIALRRHPLLNASVEGGSIRLEDHVDIGLAVATDAGLLVPVIRSADELPLRAVSQVARDLAARAREGRLSPADMECPTFTVSALGAGGIDAFTPIINPPNVAILGIGRIRDGVTWDGDRPIRQPTVTLSLTIDHRAVDGAPGAAFLASLADVLSRPLSWLV